MAENRTDIVSVLLDKGAKTDLSDTWGNTPLSDALANQRVQIAAALIGKGVHARSAAVVVKLYRVHERTSDLFFASVAYPYHVQVLVWETRANFHW